MSAPDDLAWREDVVRRLRELYDGADDEDRPRAALLLGLALADLVGQLPDDDPRRAGLAAEGLARLAESADASAAAATAIEMLRGCVAAAAVHESAPEPESFPLDGGDLNWDLDWDALHGPAEAAKNLSAMLPFIASMLPAQDPQRQALLSINEVLGAFERGQWSPRRDAALRAAITQVEAGSLGGGLGLILRTVAMFIRARRCQQVQQEGGQPDWPSPTELDALIADLESADELAGNLGVPFQAVDGLHHLFIAFTIMLRLQAGIRVPGVRHDAAWRDDILRLLGQADDHLRQTPAAFAGLTQPLRGKLAALSATLSQSFRSPQPPSASPGPARSASRAPAAPASTADAAPRAAPGPAETQLPGGTITNTGAQPWAVGPAANHISQRVLDGLRILFDQTEGAIPKGLATMLDVMDMVSSQRWTPEHGDRVAELEKEAAGLATRGESPRDHAAVAAMLAMAHAAWFGQRSMSPRPAEHTSAEDMAAIAAETESALQLVEQGIAAGPDRMLDALQGPLHALAAMQLVDLSQVDGQHRAQLLARARAHFDQLPAEMLDQIPVILEMSVLEKLIEGVIPPDDEAVSLVSDWNPNIWDQSGSDLSRGMRAVAQAGQSRTPADIGTALKELQAVWIGLPAGSPLRAQVLLQMATMQSMLAMHGGHHLGADAAGTAIAALRAAGQPDEVHAAAHLLVTTFALMLSQGDRAGPFQEAAETLRTALAKVTETGDWAPRMTLLTAIGAASVMHAEVSGEEALRADGRQAVAEAARMLPDPMPTQHWYGTARLLCAWTTAHGIYLGDAESAQLAFGLIDMLETILTDHPEVGQLTGPAVGSDDPSSELDGLRQLRQQLLAAQEQHGAAPEEAAR